MFFLYHTFIAVYTTLIRIAALFNSKARAWVSGRRHWKSEIKEFAGEGKVAWFHAASLGEFEQGRPVIEAFSKAYPGYRILLTFFSPSGFEQKKNYEGADKVMYLPADCRRNAAFFVRVLKPSIAVFIKYEFWYNYLAELKSMEVPVIFVSVVFRPAQPFFKWYGGWFRGQLKKIDHFFVQDTTSHDLAKDIGISQLTVSGDTRFDRVADILAGKVENKDVEAFCSGNKVLLAGSTWPPDEEVLKTLVHHFPDLKIIIAPHEVKEERIRQVQETFDVPSVRFMKDKPAKWASKRMLIIDTIGILSSIYRYADIAYIGGAFGSGLHNIQEPAVNGMPVIFGPAYHKFLEAVDLVRLGGAFSIHAQEELIATVATLLNDPETYRKACSVSKEYMLNNTGATMKIMEGIARYLPEK